MACLLHSRSFMRVTKFILSQVGEGDVADVCCGGLTVKVADVKVVYVVDELDQREPEVIQRRTHCGRVVESG